MEFVSMNQVRSRFLGSEDNEFEITTEQTYGKLELTFSIYRQVSTDGCRLSNNLDLAHFW